MTAFEVACKLLEDDDSKDLFEELGYAQQISKHNVEPPLVWLGRCFAHTYPGHGIALSALGFAMHYNSSNGSRYEGYACSTAMSLIFNLQVIYEDLGIRGKGCMYLHVVYCCCSQQATN